MMEVTFWKQWIHFLLSERWPPTSTILRPQQPLITVVFTLFISGAQLCNNSAQSTSINKQNFRNKRAKYECRMTNC